jgi:hypothetical protein
MAKKRIGYICDCWFLYLKKKQNQVFVPALKQDYNYVNNTMQAITNTGSRTGGGQRDAQSSR